MVFPDAAVLEGRQATKGTFTLSPGSHEFPWTFKVCKVHDNNVKASAEQI